MITADELWRLVDAMLAHVIDDANAAPGETPPSRDLVHRTAQAFDLGVEDTATLYRVASGEGVHSPAYRISYVDAG